MKIKIFILFTIISISGYAQQKSASAVTKVTFLNPGVSYEFGVGKHQTIFCQAFLNTSVSIGYSSSLGNTSSVNFEPATTIQYRYYYNSNQRIKKNKNIDLYNQNYVSPLIETVLSKRRVNTNYYFEEKARPITKVGVVWGIQRNYKKRFSLDFNIGLGYLFTKSSTFDFNGNTIKKNTNQFTTLGQLNLGFWLNKRH